jgi:hypothetical protein
MAACGLPSRRVVAARQAEPAQIGAAGEAEKVERRRAERLRADDGNQRQRRPHHVAREMAREEADSRPPPLRRADAEQRQERRPGRQRVRHRRDQRRQQEGGIDECG